ncbi:nucleoside-diphosphate-sugar epimerase [Bradyrhizobium sp. LM2.7]
MADVVFGATGMVGSYIVQHLAQRGSRVVAVSRSEKEIGHAECITADLSKAETLVFPDTDDVYCATNPRIFAKALPDILRYRPKRIVVISSTSVLTKLDSRDKDERSSIRELTISEASIIRDCQFAGVEWTLLRPTLIYREGRDRNVTQIARLIQLLRFMPLYGDGSGLRQPVHAEDLAVGAICAAKSSAAANKTYFTTGIETIPYREMVGRIFDGLSLPRRLIPLPPIVWKAAFSFAAPFYPSVTLSMGERMLTNLAFDSSAAVSDFAWNTRTFAPSFR